MPYEHVTEIENIRIEKLPEKSKEDYENLFTAHMGNTPVVLPKITCYQERPRRLLIYKDIMSPCIIMIKY